MKCTCGYMAKGDICNLCGKILKALKDETPKKPNKVGESMKKTLESYKAMKKVFIKHNPMCAVFPTRKARDIHHKKGKIGALYLDTRFWLAVSREGHIWIHANEPEAKQKGFLLSREQRDEKK